MKLSPQQVAAAKARGFVMFPATRSQIDRMTMQRRVFDVDGRPHLVSRDGLYFETHATLAPVIADVVEMAPPPVAEPPPALPVAAPVVEAAAAVPAPEPAAPEAQPDAEPTTARPLRRRLTKPDSGPVEGMLTLTAPPDEGEAPRKPVRRRAMAARVAEPTLHAEPMAEAEGPAREPEARPAIRRLWQGEQPRWQVAGAMRRGRTPRD